MTKPAEPVAALRRLLAGNQRFVKGAPLHGHDVAQARRCAQRPRPSALVIGCIDSRVPPEAIFDQGFGDLLVVRTAGHMLDDAALASVKLAVTNMHVPLVVVLGHESCAAVEYAADAIHRGERPAGELGRLVDQIAPCVPSASAADVEAYEEAARR
ncbi:MAG: carbonic anhydrase, partial [Micromonosporaceae bacterium]